ncbi:Aste57867_20514 [Aphanomyces stellatus]|uniref:Aste57867_20514 protein n=1 Tax=Aphanomyces stellatus TaxID=120398 RepID=A0A485LFR8_9STRA|nr:hypothetical protein As57867_020448 [Aphanomyces stellatus]VFT97199.1 Aste57867_20514 [Aphanomyces stellatus]
MFPRFLVVRMLIPSIPGPYHYLVTPDLIIFPSPQATLVGSDKLRWNSRSSHGTTTTSSSSSPSIARRHGAQGLDQRLKRHGRQEAPHDDGGLHVTTPKGTKALPAAPSIPEAMPSSGDAIESEVEGAAKEGSASRSSTTQDERGQTTANQSGIEQPPVSRDGVECSSATQGSASTAHPSSDAESDRSDGSWRSSIGQHSQATRISELVSVIDRHEHTLIALSDTVSRLTTVMRELALMGRNGVCGVIDAATGALVPTLTTRVLSERLAFVVIVVARPVRYRTCVACKPPNGRRVPT